MAQKTWTDADVLAEVTDTEIEALQRARTERANRVARLRTELERAETDLFTTESAIAEWIADTREAFGFADPFTFAAYAPGGQLNGVLAAYKDNADRSYAAGYAYAVGYHD